MEPSDELVEAFLKEVATVARQQRDLTSQEQVERLTRPGSKYFNLNPFEVLQLDPDATEEDAKKQYRRLSVYIHPDKCDHPRARDAFEIVNKAWRTLQDPEQKKSCLEVIAAAKRRAEIKIEDKRRAAKKEGRVHPEDPQEWKMEVLRAATAIFGETEKHRVQREEREAEERRRQREIEDIAKDQLEEKEKRDKIWESGRDERVGSWRSFMEQKSKRQKTGNHEFRPPKLVPQERPASAVIAAQTALERAATGQGPPPPSMLPTKKLQQQQLM